MHCIALHDGQHARRIPARGLQIQVAMKSVTVDLVRWALPDLEELRPILDDLLARSQADRSRAWSGSGALGTAGSRLVPTDSLPEHVSRLAREEAERLDLVYELVGRALEAFADGDRSGAAHAFLRAAALEEERDHPERAAAHADAAFRMVENERDRTLPALALRRGARARRASGDLAEALSLYRRSHDLAAGMGDARGTAEAAIGTGNVLEEQGQWDDAESWYATALEALEGVDGPAPERWHALLNLHIVARSRGRLEESVALLERAEAAAAQIDPEAAMPFVENARGQLLMARGDFAGAEERFRVAVDATPQVRARLTMRLNLAESFLARGRLLDAAEQAREAEREAIRARIVPKLPEVYRMLGRVAAEEDNPDAFVFFERALEIVKERRLPVLEEALTLQAYAEVEERRGGAETARSLRERAEACFEHLGITRQRQPWADVFGPVDSHDSEAGNDR